MPTIITLVRHGETAWNALGRWQGHAHVPLNDAGRQQARKLAHYLLPSAAEIKAIYASDSLRAFETARIIGEKLDRTVVPDARLREIDMGEWQGLTGDEVRAWDSERYRIIMSDPANLARPGGESSSQVADRAVRAIEEIVARHPDEHILTVTHGGTIVNILRRLNLWDDKTQRGPVGNTSISHLLHDFSKSPRWALNAFNLLLHLDGSDVRTEQEP